MSKSSENRAIIVSRRICSIIRRLHSNGTTVWTYPDRHSYPDHDLVWRVEDGKIWKPSALTSAYPIS